MNLHFTKSRKCPCCGKLVIFGGEYIECEPMDPTIKTYYELWHSACFASVVARINEEHTY